MLHRLDGSVPPPRCVTPPGPRPSDPIWPTLTPDQRQVLLHALGRLLAWRLSPIAEVLRAKAKAEQAVAA